MPRTDLHPELLGRDGKKQVVVLPCEEFVSVRELLEDLEDSRAPRAAEEGEAAAPVTSPDPASKAPGG